MTEKPKTLTEGFIECKACKRRIELRLTRDSLRDLRAFKREHRKCGDAK